MSEERFDPRKHNLDYAAKRLDALSRKTYRVPTQVSFDCEVELTPYGVEIMRKAAEEAAAYQPSNTFPTEQSLREFVKKCVDERLDELAREFNEHTALQPGTWRKEGE